MNQKSLNASTKKKNLMNIVYIIIHSVEDITVRLMCLWSFELKFGDQSNFGIVIGFGVIGQKAYLGAILQFDE